MLEVGSVAPEFTAKNHEGGNVSLSELRGKWVALWWYLKASTPG